MKLIVALALFAPPLLAAPGPLVLPAAPVAQSVSGQFVVYDARGSSLSPTPPGLAINTNLLELSPTLLVVSCERIKQELVRELEVKTQWRGKVQLVVRPAQTADDPITVVSERFRDGWNYRVALPQYLERQRFVRAIVHTLLLELANRNAGDRPAEIPAWLTEGLTQHLLGSRQGEFLFPPPRTIGSVAPLVLETRERDPLGAARRTLRDRPPLTLAELSWPTDEQLNAGRSPIYPHSAQLFVAELLRLNDGPASLRAMLNELPGCYNWQTAFLRAFRSHFASQLELEKWWSLQVVHFTGREPTQLWTAAESWSKLDQIIRTPVAVRRAASELPAHTDVTLPAIIREWSTPRQKAALQEKMRELELMQPRVAPEFAALVDDYRRLLATYLKRRDQAEVNIISPRQTRPELKTVVAETVAQLDALEVKRQALRPEALPPPAATVPNLSKTAL